MPGVQNKGEHGIEGVRLRLVKDRDRSMFLGDCDGGSVVHKAYPDPSCQVCQTSTQKTLNVTCEHVPAYLQAGCSKGRCIETVNRNRRELGGECKICDVETGETLVISCDDVHAQEALGNYAGQCLDQLPGECNYEFVTNSSGHALIPDVPKGTIFRVMVMNEPIGAVRVRQNRGGKEWLDSDLGEKGLTGSFKLSTFSGTTFNGVDIGYALPDDVEVFVFDDLNENGYVLKI